MKLKRYEDFNVNESFFYDTNECDEFFKKYTLGRRFFMENLDFVSDISDVNIDFNKIICDKDGNEFIEYRDSIDYFIRYSIVINYKMNPYMSIDEFFKKTDNFNEIKIGVEELIDRVSDKVSVVKSKAFIQGNRDVSEYSFIFHLSFDSINKVNDDLKKYYDKFLNTIGDNYHKMMKEIKSFYKTYDIDIDEYLTTNDVGDFVNLGVLAPEDEDLYHIADYTRPDESGKDGYDIYHDELLSSLSGFGINLRGDNLGL